MSPSAREQLGAGCENYYMPLPASAKNSSFRQDYNTTSCPIFDELPKATIVSVSRPDASDITPLLLSYVIEFQYKEFKWCLRKKASQVVYLHLSLKKRVFIEDFHEKQEQVREWLLHLGITDNTILMHDDDDDFNDEALRFNHEGTLRHRYIPSRAALPIIRPAIGGAQAIADRGKIAMQEYLNHFLGSLDIVNSREVCKFLEVSRLSFLREYGPKLKEDYVMVRHLSKILSKDDDRQCLPCELFGWCNSSWQKVWAVLKPGFLALLEDPFDTKPLDIIIFDILPAPSKSSIEKVHLAVEIKERNPLHYMFQVSSCGQSTSLRTSSTTKVKDWISAINDAAQRPVEGWSHPHRFSSFAPQRGLTRDGSEVQWFVDGRAAFESIALSIENAQSQIFITGWWLCPELYLSRPFHDNESSRLDSLLEAKAKEGVQIYILLYKEVSIALKINSSYSKRLLLGIHENVQVLRYPDHFPGILSHHEKIVAVDYQICFIGGLDLCFGRYDTVEHRVGDCPSSTWPGKDYYNPRESEPNCWQNMMIDELDREKHPRMPWHDVHCALWGPPCRDIARHFVQRWNHAKKAKAPNQKAIPLLIPHHYKSLPNYRVLPHYMGSSQTMDMPVNEEQKGFSPESPSPKLENIPLLLPQDSQQIYDSDSPNMNNYGHDQQDKSWIFSFHGSKVKPVVQSLLDNKEENYLTQDAAVWWESQRRDCQGNLMKEIPEVGPRISCNCQIVRSVAPWSAGTNQAEESIHNAYISLIQNSEHFIYIENQFFISGLNEDTTIHNRVLEALYRRILRAHREQKCFRVIIVIPLMPGFQGGIDDSGAATVRALMHWQYRTICRGENSILSRLNRVLKSKADKYISFYGLRTHGALSEGGPIVTNQIYVHSKLMIVDDRVALIGSSNINDRSLLGSRDSEIGIIIEDKEFLESTMDGKPWMVGKFTFSLRISLWLEHLGLHAGEISHICDPVADTTYRDLWMETAKANTVIYHDTFSCVPNDDIHSRASLRLKMSQLKENIGYTAIDFGVAKKVIETINEDVKIHETDPLEKLKSIRGHVVCFPLEFMREENLKPMFHEGEFYTAQEVFH
ncbi:hypothetical protein V2J09_023612 [Rumex salicifolius]